jgi:hypothetical protein
MRIKIRRNKATQSNLSFFLFLFFLVIYPLGVVSVILLNLLASETFLGSQIFSCHNVLIIAFFIATFNLSHFASLNFRLLISILGHHFFGHQHHQLSHNNSFGDNGVQMFCSIFFVFSSLFLVQKDGKFKRFFLFSKKNSTKKRYDVIWVQYNSSQLKKKK